MPFKSDLNLSFHLCTRVTTSCPRSMLIWVHVDSNPCPSTPQYITLFHYSFVYRSFFFSKSFWFVHDASTRITDKIPKTYLHWKKITKSCKAGWEGLGWGFALKFMYQWPELGNLSRRIHSRFQLFKVESRFFFKGVGSCSKWHFHAVASCINNSKREE